MSTFFNDFVAQDRGMKVQEATQILLAFGAGGALGIVGGGFLAQWLYNRRKWTMPVLMGVCTTVVRGQGRFFSSRGQLSRFNLNSALGLRGMCSDVAIANVADDCGDFPAGDRPCSVHHQRPSYRRGLPGAALHRSFIFFPAGGSVTWRGSNRV